MKRKILPLLLVMHFASPVVAHELWVEPDSFQVNSGETLAAELINGQEFVGSTLPYTTRSIVRLETRSNEEVSEYSGRLGDRPAIKLDDVAAGLLVIGYESAPLRIQYKEWEKFQSFADQKGFEDARAAHQALGASFEKFYEGYTRFSKSLIAVGNGIGADSAFGFEAELVALDNPYTREGESIAVQLFYQSKPRPLTQIEIFERAPSGEISVSIAQTNEDGITSIPVQAGHDYMLDAVIFRAPSDTLLENMDVDWETLWANLTFSVPN